MDVALYDLYGNEQFCVRSEKCICNFIDSEQCRSKIVYSGGKAGCDVNELAAIYPDTAFIGNFNKMIMHKGEAALREEFERLKPCIDRGKYVLSVDHQTPPSVSIEDYRLYVRLLKEYAKR